MNNFESIIFYIVGAFLVSLLCITLRSDFELKDNQLTISNLKIEELKTKIKGLKIKSTAENKNKEEIIKTIKESNNKNYIIARKLYSALESCKSDLKWKNETI
tara:strand:- start:219 stop:527 length:309 start_codon:yes stop_codon:yes gene_type:complete